MDTKEIIRHLYQDDLPKKRKKRVIKRTFGRRLHLRRATLIITISIVTIVALWALVHVHYYNELIDLRFNVGEAWAQVETQLQKRAHIQKNLLTISKSYAQHERDVLTSLTKIRSSRDTAEITSNDLHGVGNQSTNTAGSLLAESQVPPELPTKVDSGSSTTSKNILPSLSINAEQYPQLMLSNNLQQFSKAIIETENEIASKTIEYNTAVNKYSTAISQFPGNIFAEICGFEEVDFYNPDRDILAFRQVEY